MAGGIACTVALFLQFSAFDYLPVWAVSLFQGTQAVWTLAWTALFLRHEEHIGPELLMSVALIAGGVAIMTVGL